MPVLIAGVLGWLGRALVGLLSAVFAKVVIGAVIAYAMSFGVSYLVAGDNMLLDYVLSLLPANNPFSTVTLKLGAVWQALRVLDALSIIVSAHLTGLTLSLLSRAFAARAAL